MDPTPNTLGINRFSPSMIMDYEGCPRKFYYATFLGLRLPQSMKHLEFGNAMHSAIGNIYDQYDEETAWLHAEKKLVKQTFKEQFPLSSLDPDERNTKGEKVYPTEADRVAGWEAMKADGLSIIDSYWDEKEVLLAEHGVCPSRLEIPVKMEIKNLVTGTPFEIPVSCRLDGENADGSIIELKTSKNAYDERETRKSAQSLTYVLTKFLTLGRIVPLTYVVMRKGVKGPDRIQILRYEYEEADLFAFMGRIEAFIEGVRARNFSKSTVNHPRFCDCAKFDALFENAL